MSEGKPRILVVFLHGLGDNIMATPALRGLKKKFPKSHITLMCLKTLPAKDIWEANPYVDEVVESKFPFNPRWWHPIAYFFSDHWKLLKEIRKLDREKRFDKVYIVKLFLDRRFKSHKIIRIAKELNVILDDYKTDFFVSKEDINEAEKILRKYKLKSGRYVCLHRTASDYDRKSWSMKDAQDVCNALKEKVLVFNSDKSFRLEENKESGHLKGKNVVNYISKNLRVSAAILKKSKGLIGIDSIMSHIAGAFEVPAIVLYKGAKPHKYMPIVRKKFTILTKDFTAENILRNRNW